ncbi:MAG: RNA polymerase sigma factor [Lachnospiraceae bacterium]|nr:RNA polymerase sigma factor [Lachnospiraceae bacterium]
MTYTEAIQMALSGDERGYTFLYEETYKSKMYLAIQYMKNEDDAMDILQDAYVKAFAKLDTLQDPEKFPSWFGMIVANTAKNALVKKNPVLFTDMAADPDAEPFEYSIEDENLSHQPELSYTSEETRLLVREMMDALSEEQRVCVLMFHIDGIPIKEIAETLGCSENTVKSRLNYARKNIKKQGEELQKKGYQLYEIAPFTLLLLLLHKDASAMSGEAEFISAGAKVEQAVFQNGSSFAGEAAGNAMAGENAATPAGENAASSVMGDAAAGEGVSAGTGAASSAAGNAAAGTVAKSAAGAAGKSALLSTAAGKITAGVIGAVLIGGSVFGVSHVVQNNQNRSTPTASIQEEDETESVLSGETESETIFFTATEMERNAEMVSPEQIETESETQPDRALAVQPVSDDAYSTLLEGSLTKEEMEFVLAYAVDDGYDSEETLAEEAYRSQYLRPLFASGTPLEILASDEHGWHSYDLDEVNRLLSVFTDYRITEDNDWDSDTNTRRIPDVEDDILWMSSGGYVYLSKASIDAAGFSGDEMVILYTYHKVFFETDEYKAFASDEWEQRAAVLLQGEDGRYSVKSVLQLKFTNMGKLDDTALAILQVLYDWVADTEESVSE